MIHEMPDAKPKSRAPLRGRIEPAQRRQGRRPTARSLDTRERVIAAAAHCIAEEGFALAHTNRIAERAGVSWGVLQYHFGDKGGLLDAVLERGFEEIERAFRDIEIEGEIVRERVTALVDAAWALFRAPLARAGNEILVNTRHSLAGDPHHEEQLQLMSHGLYRQARRALRQAAGETRPPRYTEGVLLAALRGFALALMMQPRDVDFAGERMALVEMLTRTIEESD